MDDRPRGVLGHWAFLTAALAVLFISCLASPLPPFMLKQDENCLHPWLLTKTQTLSNHSQKGVGICLWKMECNPQRSLECVLFSVLFYQGHPVFSTSHAHVGKEKRKKERKDQNVSSPQHLFTPSINPQIGK